ncbi:MAG: hypothetical protein CL912_27435 [Deltaproteobacteria bacterium]|nr:hypothetical protein [Deltaproteobacteria bacterium]
MLVTGSPQFDIQDDSGNGSGIAPIAQWLSALKTEHNPDLRGLACFDIDSSLKDILIRLQVILYPPISRGANLCTNDLHDLTCYVLHKLLLPFTAELTPESECLRYALAIYMFVIHGPTYYSHLAILHQIVLKLRNHLRAVMTPNDMDSSLLIWCFSIGMSASIGTEAHDWFITSAAPLTSSQGLETLDNVESCLQSILPLDAQSKAMFHVAWQPIFNSTQLAEELPGKPTTALENLANHGNNEQCTKGSTYPAESSTNPP